MTDVEPFWLEDDPIGLPGGIDRCPACLYQMDGLPPTGLCPECGQLYDKSCIILFGYRNIRPPRTIGRIAIELSWTAVMLLVMLHSDPRWTASNYIFLLVILGTSWWGTIAQFFARHAPLQAWLTSQGCAQRRFNRNTPQAAPTLRDWKTLRPPRFIRQKHGSYQLRIFPLGQWWVPFNAVVNGSFICSDEQVIALKAKLSSWQSGYIEEELTEAIKQFKEHADHHVKPRRA